MPPSEVVETAFHVRYAETDAMGIVYHANYIVWFEVGRGAFFRQQGANYADWESHGIALPVVEVYARYLAPARYPDLVKVRTWVKEVHSRAVTFAYEVQLAQTGQTLVTGWTKHVCIDREGHVRTIPPELKKLLGP